MNSITTKPDEPFDDILYEIGLCLTSVRDPPERQLHNNPLIVFTLITLFMIGRTLSIITPDDDIQTLLITGDVGHFFGLKLHYNMIFIFGSILCLVFQLIHYLNHRNSIKNKFIGETQDLDIEELRKLKDLYTKICKIIKDNNTYLIPFVCVVINLTPFILFTTLAKTILFGIPHCIHYIFWGYYAWNNASFQFIQFYIICKYLKQRVRHLDQILCETKRKRHFRKIAKTLESIDSLYNEINEYNTTFWSKFLFAFWLTFGALIVWLVFSVVFLPFPLMVRIMFIYATVVMSALYLFTILNAAPVSHSVNKFYNSLNSMFISFSKQNKHALSYRVPIKYKV